MSHLSNPYHLENRRKAALPELRHGSVGLVD
jgi:hypothetical protein